MINKRILITFINSKPSSIFRPSSIMQVVILKYYDVSTEETFSRTLSCLNDSDVLEIIEIPTAQRAFHLFSQPWFKEGLNSLNSRSIKFKVDEELKVDKYSILKLDTYDGAILVALESSFSSGCQFYWKLTGSHDDFYSLNVQAGCGDFTHKFLGSSLRSDRDGL